MASLSDTYHHPNPHPPDHIGRVRVSIQNRNSVSITFRPGLTNIENGIN